MAFNPDQPRDEKGRWTEGGGAAGGPDTRTHDVGGDQWNRETAVRLENEYEAVRGTLDTMAHHAEENSEEVTVATPAGWDDLSSDQQESAEEKFKEDHYNSEYDHAVEGWHENGDSYVDAAKQLAEDDDWKHEALKEFIEQREEQGEARIPFKPEDLADAITINTPDYGEAYSHEKKKPDIQLDDSKLQNPDNFNAKQQTLPGIEPVKPEESLTKEMRDALVEHLTEKFVHDAEDKSSDVEPPEYLADSAKESLADLWDQMDDDEKYNSAKQYLDLDSDKNDEPQTVTMPDKWDPLNDTSGEDYRATQTMARYLQTQRGLDLLKERNILKPNTKLGPSVVDSRDSEMRDSIANANHQMWESWKDSSSSRDGMMIQVAAHEELGGRLNQHKQGINIPDAKSYADNNYKSVGGYQGVKALVRATWETSQYLLDKANLPMLDVYRGIDKEDLKRVAGTDTSLDKYYIGTGPVSVGANAPTGVKEIRSEPVTVDGRIYTRLPDMHVGRNGAASWTTDPYVANGWKEGAVGHTTLRAEVPRTAVLSLPAYGINLHSEHEVVVIGTAWKAWDAFAGKAPKISEAPLAHVAKATPVKHTKAEKAHVASTYKELTT